MMNRHKKDNAGKATTHNNCQRSGYSYITTPTSAEVFPRTCILKWQASVAEARTELTEVTMTNADLIANSSSLPTNFAVDDDLSALNTKDRKVLKSSGVV
jgi:hypothetical protein